MLICWWPRVPVWRYMLFPEMLIWWQRSHGNLRVRVQRVLVHSTTYYCEGRLPAPTRMHSSVLLQMSYMFSFFFEVLRDYLFQQVVLGENTESIWVHLILRKVPLKFPHVMMHTWFIPVRNQRCEDTCPTWSSMWRSLSSNWFATWLPWTPNSNQHGVSISKTLVGWATTAAWHGKLNIHGYELGLPTGTTEQTIREAMSLAMVLSSRFATETWTIWPFRDELWHRRACCPPGRNEVGFVVYTPYRDLCVSASPSVTTDNKTMALVQQTTNSDTHNG